MTSSRAAPRSIRILVLGNAAAGAEKQALALGARLQERLRRHPAAVSVERASDDVRCVRVPLHSESIARRLPPLLHVAIARLRGDAFFGYDLAETHKKQLLPQRGKGSSDAATAKHRPLNVVIGCGRTTVALCATLKLMAESKSDVFNIQIQHPRVPLAWFDAVVAPRHDFPTRSTARSLLPKQLHLTTGTVCDIKSDVLRAHAEEWRHELAKHCTEARRHHVAWLIGGPCRGFAFTAEDAEQMASEFVDVMAHKELNPEDEVSIFVVAIIQKHLQDGFPHPDQLFIWDGQGKNPYYALLANATIIVTTPDSISMTTEAIAAKKTVFTISAERAKGKFHRFHQSLFQTKFTTPFARETVMAALHPDDSRQEQQPDQLAPADALEQELDAIADAVTKEIIKER